MLVLTLNNGCWHIFLIAKPCRLAHQGRKMLRCMRGVKPAITPEITINAIVSDKAFDPFKRCRAFGANGPGAIGAKPFGKFSK